MLCVTLEYLVMLTSNKLNYDSNGLVSAQDTLVSSKNRVTVREATQTSTLYYLFYILLKTHAHHQTSIPLIIIYVIRINKHCNLKLIFLRN